MLKKFVCLANSFKEGGRCIAGVELDKNNNPITSNGKPKWIRPIHNTEHGQIPNHIAESFHVLDIIELDIIAAKPEGYQSENITFDENTLTSMGTFNREQLSSLCEINGLIFGNRGKAVPHDTIGNLNHSLMLVNVSTFDVVQVIYDDHPDKPKYRLTFEYNHNHYDLPITDPSFLHKYQLNSGLLENTKQLYLTLSLAVPLKSWYYKLVAGVIY